MASLIHQISWVGRVSHDCSHCAVSDAMIMAMEWNHRSYDCESDDTGYD